MRINTRKTLRQIDKKVVRAIAFGIIKDERIKAQNKIGITPHTSLYAADIRASAEERLKTDSDFSNMVRQISHDVFLSILDEVDDYAKQRVNKFLEKEDG